MNTTYKNSIASPFQMKQDNKYERKDPLREEIEKNIKTFNLTATVEEDKNTLSLFKHVPGPIISYICTLRKDSEVIGIGRGSAILTRINKYFDRAVRYAFNASLIDSMVNSTKVLDALYLKGNTEIPVESYITELASGPQKRYLRDLVSINVLDETERNNWESRIEEMTKEEASESIKSFMK